MDPRLSPTDDRTLLRARARAALESGQLDTARDLLELLRALGDTHPTTALLTASWLVASERRPDALAVLQQVIVDAEQTGDNELREAVEAWRDVLSREM
jgi:hypothetical protein